MIFDKSSISTFHFVINCEEVLNSAIKQLLPFFLKADEVVLVDSIALSNV